MTEDEQNQATDRLLATVGRYVIVFQWIESKVEQCLMLWWGHTPANRDRLSQMTNKQKVDALWEEFQNNPANARGAARQDWVAKFEELIERLHLARRRRNKLLHSHYLFDFLKIGQPVLQVDPREGAIRLSDEAQQTLLSDLDQLGWDMNFAHVQIIQDYPMRPPTDSAARDIDAT